MKVTALIENTKLEGRDDLTAEHGLALHIQYQGGQILFDTGATGEFVHNAEVLGVDLRGVERVVLSHHHFDHGGGLRRFMEVNAEAPVYLKRNEAGMCYFRLFGIVSRYIGLDLGLLQEQAGRLVVVDEFTEIAPGVFIITEIGRPYPLPKGNRYLFVKGEQGYELDLFEHELVLVVQEDDGLAVFTGGSHRGILNMVDTVAKRFAGRPIKAVFGGFHLIGLPLFNSMAGSRKEVAAIGRKMLTYPVEKVYTGHCTGAKAYRVLKEAMGEHLEYLPTGRSVEV